MLPDVTLMLADAASTVAGKVYVLGGGWTSTAPGLAPFAVVASILLPHDAAGSHEWELALYDEAGEPAKPEEAEDDEIVIVGGSFTVEKRPHSEEGVPLSAPLAMTFGPMPLEGGKVFEWRFSLDGQHDPRWRVRFSTRRVVGEESEPS